MRIVGIGGLPRSGKDTLADLLIERGWFGLSFGDVVRDFARKRHSDKPDPISVANMTETSNWLRETRGSDVILHEALQQYEAASKAKTYEGLVLYSVRAPVEVDWILAHDGELIWVEASAEVRHRRNLMSQREGEAVIDLEEFKRQEALQWQPQPGIPAEVQMDLAYVKTKATIALDNSDNDLADFKQAAIRALGLA
jgi:dephospho-CoA kinase